MDLFDHSPSQDVEPRRPLAARMRPALAEFAAGLPDGVDLAVLMVPVDSVPEVVEAMAEASQEEHAGGDPYARSLDDSRETRLLGDRFVARAHTGQRAARGSCGQRYRQGAGRRRVAESGFGAALKFDLDVEIHALRRRARNR